MTSARAEFKETASPFRRWAAAGFAEELLPLCGPHHECASPGKVPHLPGWQQCQITPALFRSHAGNLGLRTRRFPAVDIDVEEPEIAATLEQVVVLTLGSTARRTRGNSARRLLLFRLEGEPFGKVVVKFTTPAGETARVEVLGDGQQCVVAGVHHTGGAIEWPAGPPAAAGLAPIAPGLRDRLVFALRQRLGELGCHVEGPTPAPGQRALVIPLRDDTRDAEVAGCALRRLDPDLMYDEWIQVGMALHSRWPDADGLALWDAWSSHGKKYPGTRALERHWASFRTGRGVGFGTLVVLARRAG